MSLKKSYLAHKSEINYIVQCVKGFCMNVTVHTDADPVLPVKCDLWKSFDLQSKYCVVQSMQPVGICLLIYPLKIKN